MYKPNKDIEMTITTPDGKEGKVRYDGKKTVVKL